MDITVRPVELFERDAWESLFQAYAGFYKTTVAEEAFDKVWAWIFDEQEEFWCDVAVSDAGKILGFTQYQLMHRSLSGGKVCYLSDLFVDPNLRGKGTGKVLIDHVMKFAKKNDISNVRWLTQEYNYRARGLYDTYAPRSDFILYAVPVD